MKGPVKGKTNRWSNEGVLKQNLMERGSDVLNKHLGGTNQIDIRQTRRGCCQEFLGCEAPTEMKYYVRKDQVAQSLEESNFCCRCICAPVYPFKTVVREVYTGAEILTAERPCRCVACGCKCCCYQEMSVSSGGYLLGKIKENFYCCVPSFGVYDNSDIPVYTIHPPTCCCGVCVNCCTEGNPCCGEGCCKVPFWIFDANDKNTNGSNANKLGKIVKVPKSLMVEIFTSANAFEVVFPAKATVEHRGLLTGSSLLLNAIFFEGD